MTRQIRPPRWLSPERLEGVEHILEPVHQEGGYTWVPLCERAGVADDAQICITCLELLIDASCAS